jgi:hypothetical protein
MTVISESSRCVFCKSNPTLLVDVLKELKERKKAITDYEKIINEQDKKIKSTNKPLENIVISVVKFYVILFMVFLLGCCLSFGWLYYYYLGSYQALSSTHHK